MLSAEGPPRGACPPLGEASEARCGGSHELCRPVRSVHGDLGIDVAGDHVPARRRRARGVGGLAIPRRRARAGGVLRGDAAADALLRCRPPAARVAGHADVLPQLRPHLLGRAACGLGARRGGVRDLHADEPLRAARGAWHAHHRACHRRRVARRDRRGAAVPAADRGRRPCRPRHARRHRLGACRHRRGDARQRCRVARTAAGPRDRAVDRSVDALRRAGDRCPRMGARRAMDLRHATGRTSARSSISRCSAASSLSSRISS